MPQQHHQHQELGGPPAPALPTESRSTAQLSHELLLAAQLTSGIVMVDGTRLQLCQRLW